MVNSRAVRRKRKRVSLFYVIYFTLILVFFACLFFALIVVKQKLISYESSRPYKYMERVIAEKFVPGGAEELLELAHYEASPFDERSDAVALVEEYLSAGVDYYEVTSGNDTDLKWALTSEGLKFAVITMTPSGEVDESGYPVYVLSSVEMMIGGTHAVNIASPGDSTVYLNGIQLTDAYVTETETLERDIRGQGTARHADGHGDRQVRRPGRRYHSFGRRHLLRRSLHLRSGHRRGERPRARGGRGLRRLYAG